VVPSPKSQSTDVGAGVDVFVNVTASFMQELAGLIKLALIKFITTAFGFVMVVMQPVLLLTLRLTVKLPCDV
jgi:hypothetical protein